MTLEELQTTVEDGAACAGEGTLMEGATRLERLAAARLCADCPVLDQCAELAAAYRAVGPIVGVWAGRWHRLGKRPQDIRPTLTTRTDHGTCGCYQAGCGCPVCFDGEAQRTAERRRQRAA